MNAVDFQTLYNTWNRKAFFFVKSYVQDEMVAEDIVAESLVKLWKLLAEKDIRQPEAFLLTLLKNKALDHLRHESVRISVEEDLMDAYQRELSLRISTLKECDPDKMFSEEIKQIIEHTLSLLPIQTRKIFEMSRFEGLSVKEIAEIQNLSVKAIEYHITQALKSFRISLKDYLYVFYFFF